MHALIEQANLFVNLAKKLNDGEITLEDLPMSVLLEIIDNTYSTITSNTISVKGIYQNMLMQAYNAGCIENVVSILQLVGFHLAIIGGIRTELLEKTNKSMQLRCQLSYVKNMDKVNQLCTGKTTESCPFSEKGVVYTAVFGNYDNICTPKVIDENMDYILFTDNEQLKSDVWNIRLINPSQMEEFREIHADPVRISRKIKVLGYRYLKEYDFSVWVDGSMEIIGSLYTYIERYKQRQPILCVNHSQTDCTYKEAQTCINLKKDNSDVIKKQMDRYKAERYPEHYGLIESGLLVRELHNPKLNEAMDLWWQEIKNGSRRDQLSFNYVCWKKQMLYDTSDIVIWDNEYVSVGKHNQISDRKDKA